MADANIASPDPVADSDSSGEQGNEGGDTTENNTNQAEQARRQQQSLKDKALAAAAANDDGDDTRENIDFLMAKEHERSRDSYVSDFLSENATKYPNVKAEDLKFATSVEEVEELATHFENRYKDMQQEALKSVQTAPDEGLTDKQIAEQEVVLEKEVNEQGVSKFSSFLGNLQRRKN